jgi:hypothetical protein
MYTLLCSLLLCSVPLCAQTSFGNLVGTVYGQAGVKLGRATVAARNTATGMENCSQTDASGAYRLTNVPAGNYFVRFSAASFSAVQFNDIEIQQNKTVSIDATLPFPEATAVSVVSVAAPLEFTDPAPPQATSSPEDLKAGQREVAALRDRLALSADQQLRICSVFQDRQLAIAGIRDDASLVPSERREKIRALRAATEAKFRALLNENQLDEYAEILRERSQRKRSLANGTEAHTLDSYPASR